MSFRLPRHKTRIVATIGPASRSSGKLRDMIRAGMNVARLNLAHGSPEQQRDAIERIRAASARVGRHVAILGDLPGPKIRVGELPREPLELRRNSEVVLVAGERARGGRIPVAFPRLAQVLRPGSPVYVNDGFIELAVEEVTGDEVRCRVLVGGVLTSYKGINLPDADLGLAPISAEDKRWLQFAAEVGLDAISVSFVESGRDIESVRRLTAQSRYEPFVIAKIERARAVQRFDGLLDAADGIMIARGDLGVETPIEEIGMIQKRLIQQANLRGKPVITATQMLESMTLRKRPTRAEVTDVSNAILDGTDCVMLSQESAVGSYPVEAVRMLARIARVVERGRAGFAVREELSSVVPQRRTHVEDVIALNVFNAVERLNPRFVVTPTETGATVRRIARFRMATWILAFSPHPQTCARLCFSYGVYPVCFAPGNRPWLRVLQEWFAEHGFNRGRVVMTQGPSGSGPGGTNQLAVIDLRRPETLESTGFGTASG